MMQHHEAEELAKRIINIWRLTPALPEWRDYLAPLNATRAANIIERLRVTVDGALSIAKFHAAYQTDLNDERRHRPATHVCGDCRLPNDDHTLDCPHRPIPWTDDRSRAGYENGYRIGQVELYGISSGQLGAAPVTVEEKDLAIQARRHALGEDR